MNKIGATDLRNRLHHQHPNLGFHDSMEATVDPCPGVPIGCRSPRKRGPYSTPKHRGHPSPRSPISSGSLALLCRLSRCAIERCDELGSDRMVGAWVLTRDQLTIHDDVWLEILAKIHLTTGVCERLWRIEIHLGVQNFVFDPLFLACREDRHCITSIWPAFGHFLRLCVIAGD